MTKLVKTSSLTSSDLSICAPDYIEVSDAGEATAKHVSSGDTTYPALGALCVAYQLDQDAVEALLSSLKD